MEKNILEVKNLTVYFDMENGVLKAVDNVNFNIPKGKTVCIVGESGCGKSKTAMSIMGLLNRKEDCRQGGKITLNVGEDSIDILEQTEKDMEKIRGSKISMIFQEPMTSLNPVYKIGPQIEEILKLHKEELDTNEPTNQWIKERALELLSQVGINNSKDVYNMYPHELSGGMRQRVMIAIAIACKPELIVADEPTTALDVTIQKQILDLLSDLKEKSGASILLITHDLGVVAKMADIVIVMYAGRIVEMGCVTDIFLNTAHPYTAGLMKSRPSLSKDTTTLYTIPGNVANAINLPNQCYFYDRCDKKCEKCQGDYPDTTDLGNGHYVNCHNMISSVLEEENTFVPDIKKDGDIILEVKDLKKYYETKSSILGRKKYVKAVDGVSFSLQRGSTLGLVGESGCGKTTTGKAILRLDDGKTSGEIIFNGKSLLNLGKKDLRKIRGKMQIIFQDPYSSLPPHMTVKQIISEPVIEHNIVPKAEVDSYVEKIMEDCGLIKEFANRVPSDFSGGQRQRICIARAIAMKPELIICDEPVSALDVSIQSQIINLLKKLQQECGITYLFISHDLSVVKHICDNVLVMYEGKIVEAGTKTDIFENPQHPYTKKLLEAVPEAKIKEK